MNSQEQHTSSDMVTRQNRSDSVGSEASVSSSLSQSSLYSLSERARREHDPSVVAMLSSNRMRDCTEIRDMYMHCAESKKGSESRICETARKYFVNCSDSEK
jgi:hypothetical protein